MSKQVFVYGTLLEGEVNHHRMAGAIKLADQVWVEGLLFDVGCGYPALFPCSQGKVIGELYEVNDEILRGIDLLEGYYGENDPGNYYDRVLIQVFAENADYEAITYVFSQQQVRPLTQIESGDWVNYVREGR